MPKLKYPSPNTNRYGAHYESVADFIGALEQSNQRTKRMEYFLRSPKEDWFGTPGLSTGLDLIGAIRNGWESGATRIEALIESVADEVPKPMSIRRRAQWSDQGSEVEMQRIWGGQLDTAWRRVMRAPGNNKRSVRIIIDSIAFGGETAETMRWRGLTGATLAVLLSRAGYRVELLSAFQAKSGGTGPMLFSCVIKPMDAYISPTELAACVTPGFFRALGHAWGQVVDTAATDSGGYWVEDVTRADQFVNADSFDFVKIIPQSVQYEHEAKELIAQTISQLQSDNEEILEAA